IEAFLVGSINYALTASTDFLQQLVVAKVCKHSCWCSGFLPIRCLHAVIATGVNDPGHRFVRERSKAGFQKTSWANSWRCVVGGFCSAPSTNTGGSLHFDDRLI